MNIFKLDNDPIISSKYHHFGHLSSGKMILEASQLLCSAVRYNLPELFDPRIYKAAYVHHPCTIAVSQSRSVFYYTAVLGLELNNERMWRYSKPSHKSCVAIRAALEYIDSIPDVEVTWPLAMPDQYKTNDPVESYRNYYIGQKSTNKNGNWMMYYYPQRVPDWIPEHLRQQIKNQEILKFGQTAR